MHTTQQTTLTRTYGAQAIAAVRGAVARVNAMVRAWRNRRDVEVLLEFDDRMLADIGLTRTDVTSALASPSDVDPSRRLRVIAVERRAAYRAQARERIADIADADAIDDPVANRPRMMS